MINIDKIAHQKDYEKLVFVLRRHWIILFGYFFIFFLEVFLPLAVIVALQSLIVTLLVHPIIGPLLILLASLYALFILLFFFNNFIDYYLDVWIVTNERLTAIEQKGLFSRTVAELRYYRVQDVQSEVRGIIPTIFGYGNIMVQTAGTQPRFLMKQVPRAHSIAKRIQALMEEDHKYHDGKMKAEGIV